MDGSDRARWTVLSGAGVSMSPPVSLLASAEIRSALLETLTEKAAAFAPGAVDEQVRSRIKRAEWRLEYILGRIFRSSAVDLEQGLLSCFRVDVPARSHLMLAAHLSTGALEATLNYDNGIERAYAYLNPRTPIPLEWPEEYQTALKRWRAYLGDVPPLTVVGSRSQFESWRRMPRSPVLFKLHGGLNVRGVSEGMF